jgi:hypothetical protein
MRLIFWRTLQRLRCLCTPGCKGTYHLISFVMPPDIVQNGQWARKRLGLGDHLESDSNIDMTMVDYYRSNYFNPVTISVEMRSCGTRTSLSAKIYT